MDSRAQSMLEFMFFYGWSGLILITVIGTVIVALAPIERGPYCSLSDPVRFSLVSVSLPEYDLDGSAKYWHAPGDGYKSNIALQNLVGSDVWIIELKKDGYFSDEVLINPQGYRIPTAYTAYGVVTDSKNCQQINGGDSVLISRGQKFEIEGVSLLYSPASNARPVCDDTSDSFDSKSGNIYLTYVTRYGLTRSLIISCQEFPGEY